MYTISESYNKGIINEDTRHAEAILDCFKFERVKIMKTEKSLYGEEVKIADLSEMSPLEGDKEKI